MTKQKLSLRRLFSNTKFLIIFSIVVAFIFWIVVAIQYAPIDNTTITNVPVQIEMENSIPHKLGLQIFGQKDFAVDVTVRGSRFSIGGKLLSAESFDAVAQTAYVNSSGKHTLQVKVTPKNPSDDFEIVGVSTDYIEVFFDKSAEKEIEVTPKIISDLSKYTDDGYMFDSTDVILQSKTVTLTGAQSEIGRINKVYSEIPIKNLLTECVTVDAPLTFDVDSSLTSHVKVKGYESYSMPVTLPVYKTETLVTSVQFKNSPSDYVKKPLEFQISPASVNVAVLQNGSMTDDKLVIGTIDFNDISNGELNFSFDADKISNVRILDDISRFNVDIDTEQFSLYKFDLEKSNVSLISPKSTENVVVDLSSTPSISVIGDDNSLSSLSSSDIFGKIDLSDVKLSQDVETKVPIDVFLKDSKRCWVYGKYYAYLTLK